MTFIEFCNKYSLQDNDGSQAAYAWFMLGVESEKSKGPQPMPLKQQVKHEENLKPPHIKPSNARIE